MRREGPRLGRPAIWGWDVDRTVDVVDATFALPAGTVTFLLSGVEASTRLWEAEPDAMAKAMPVLYELVAEAVRRQGGVRPVEQGEGDSVVAAFSRASDAIAAALEAAAGGVRAIVAGRDRATRPHRASHCRGPVPPWWSGRSPPAHGSRCPRYWRGLSTRRLRSGSLNGRATRWPGTRSEHRQRPVREHVGAHGHRPDRAVARPT